MLCYILLGFPEILAANNIDLFQEKAWGKAPGSRQSKPKVAHKSQAEALDELLFEAMEVPFDGLSGVFLSSSALVAARRALLAATFSLMELILVLVFSLTAALASFAGSV
jgi:hypothetical protein